jgi:uncharacterized protein (DUF4415 family)
MTQREMKPKTIKANAKQGGDPENPGWTREEFARAMTFDKLPAGLREKLSSRKRGPQMSPRKVPVSIRLSTDVVEAFRASGAGWQARVDEILREHIK